MLHKQTWRGLHFLLSVLFLQTIPSCLFHDGQQNKGLAPPKTQLADSPSRQSPCEFRQQLTKQGVKVEIFVPSGEACSLGTFHLKFTFQDGSAQQVVHERDGTITNVWLDDLRNDGSLDLVVSTASVGSGSYGTVTLYQKEGTEFRFRQIAPLSPRQERGYMGHDVFEVKGGSLFRSFPLYGSQDKNARPGGETVQYRYAFRHDKWERIVGQPD